MKKVAVFGNAAGGKSTLARRLAELTGLPLHPLDTIQYSRGGGKVPHEVYLEAHAELLARDQWIIDGFGCVTSAWERFAAATKRVHHLRSPEEMSAFLAAIEQECGEDRRPASHRSEPNR